MILCYTVCVCFQSIDGQIRQREGASDGAQTAVRSLEVQHVTGLSDLRGRVARCDAAIARLAADSKTSNDSIRQLSLQQQQQEARLNDKLKSLDSKVCLLTIYPIINLTKMFYVKGFVEALWGGGGGGGASTPKFGYSPPPPKSAHISLSLFSLPLSNFKKSSPYLLSLQELGRLDSSYLYKIYFSFCLISH